jgi:hypothetical protein
VRWSWSDSLGGWFEYLFTFGVVVLVVAIVGMPCVRDIFILKVLDLDGVLSRTEVCPSWFLNGVVLWRVFCWRGPGVIVWFREEEKKLFSNFICLVVFYDHHINSTQFNPLLGILNLIKKIEHLIKMCGMTQSNTLNTSKWIITSVERRKMKT